MTSTLDIRNKYPDSSPHHARRVLRDASQRLSERGLVSASKWALELLICVQRPELDEIKSPKAVSLGLPGGKYSSTPSQKLYPTQSTPALNWDKSQTPDLSGRFHSMRVPASPYADPAKIDRADQNEASTSTTSAHVHFASSADVSILSSDESSRFKHGGGLNYEENWGEEDEDAFLLAKNLFDHHQWERCASLLENRKVQGPKALFLKLYAQYLVGEAGISKAKQNKVLRKELIPLLRDLIDPSDPFLLFLKGILFRKLNKRIEAMDCILRSLEVFPYNWSAWQELSTTLEGGQAELQEIAPMLPISFMTSFFCELFGRSSAGRMINHDSLDRIDSLMQIFPNAPYLFVCKGQNLHLMQELEASEEAYEEARAIDPFRLEGMADYSNSLFVQSKEEKLAHLTHSLAEAGREDAEVCCAVGNYHTLRGDNHRAVEVFKRGVRLDPSCSSAWILLGHAYIELKDSIAASEMYRKALELNPRDVRAWTGLGNTYELNSAWAYALHYHKKAAANSPYDYRFWASMANCYEKLRQYTNAIECYKKILTLEDNLESQLAVMDNITRLFEDGELGDIVKACIWHRRIVELIEKNRLEGHSDIEGNSSLVKDHVQSYVIAARWEMGDISLKRGTVTAGEEEEGDEEEDDDLMQVNGEDYSDFLASKHRRREQQQSQIGNLDLANDYLKRVILTGTEAALEAEELLSRLATRRT
ncbi:hypothetical protein CBS101457_001244 [Exobasidium rhododendri]|nr:hypothetical protein CBS101457_001244 [Exobasidium rhododendri]